MKRFSVIFMFSVLVSLIYSLCYAGGPWDWSGTINNYVNQQMMIQQMLIDRQLKEEQLRLQQQEMENRETERRQKEKEDQAALQKREEKKAPPVFDIRLRPILLKAHPDYEEIIKTKEYWE